MGASTAGTNKEVSVNGSTLQAGRASSGHSAALGEFDEQLRRHRREATSDVATDDEHDPEGHTIAWERQQIVGLLDEMTATLADIEVAEQRLDTGLYGTCTTCGLEIAAPRLEALPATPTCVNCAS